jgi:hypothetical protein
MVDVARLGLAVDSSQVEKGTVSLHQLTGAAGQASAAARQLAGASQVEAVGQKAATAATAAHTAAIQANNAAMRMGTQVRTNMIYQLNDIGVSLASGMSPLIVAVQQVPQMLQFGLKPAIDSLVGIGKSLVTTFWPVAAVVGAVSLAFAGMTHEINETSKVTVGFGDVALATFQVIAGGIYQFIKPATDMIGGWFSDAWDWVVGATKDAGNAMIRNIVGSIEYIKTSISTVPAAFIIAGQAAAQGFADAIANGINSVIGNINSLIGGINQMAGQEVISALGPVSFGKIEFGGTAAMEDYNKSWGAYARTVGALQERDFMGEFFGAVSSQAQKNASAPDEDALKRAASAAQKQAEAYQDIVRSAQQRIDQSELEIEMIGMTAVEMGRLRHEQELLNQAANDNIKLTPQQTEELGALAQAMAVAEEAARKAKESFEFGKDLTKGFLSDLRQGLSDGASFWEAFGQAGMSVLDKIIDKIETNLVDALFSMGGSGGGGLGGIFGMIGSLFGFADGGVFSGGHVQPFARGGIVNSPTLFPMANGAGLMGEAGPEAIMPLRRGADGKLGVAANSNGGGSMHVNVGVSIDDEGKLQAYVKSVSRQEAQTAAAAGTQVAVAQANKTAPAAVAKYQEQRAGSDYRTM